MDHDVLAAQVAELMALVRRHEAMLAEMQPDFKAPRSMEAMRPPEPDSKELIEARSNAGGMIATVENRLYLAGETIPGDVRDEVQRAAERLKYVMRAVDVGAIKAGISELDAAAGKLAKPEAAAATVEEKRKEPAPPPPPRR